MKNCKSPKFSGWFRSLVFISLMSFAAFDSAAQCVIEAGKVKGLAFLDFNNDGIRDVSDDVVSGVLVSVYDMEGALIGNTTTGINGAYTISSVTTGSKYRLVFDYPTKYRPGRYGTDNRSTVQFVTAPVCANIGLIDINQVCSSNPELVLTCFVQGAATGNIESIVGINHNFTETSAVAKYATHGETGSIWGLAWKSNSSEIFSSAFVKQYSALKGNLAGAIYSTKVSSSSNTTGLYVDLSTKGVDVGQESLITDFSSCGYGAQAGKVGLGSMVIDPDQDYLYVTNLYGKSIVKVSTTDPNDVTEYPITDPGCQAGGFRPFALKYHNGKIYVGVTCSVSSTSQLSQAKAVIYEWDPQTPSLFSNIFETNYIKAYWYDSPADGITVSHWFTDLDFTNDGNMVISFTDRIGHRYCKPSRPTLDVNNPDILLVYKDSNGQWKFEENGSAGALEGSGMGNGQGPNGGEFFEDHWPGAPTVHKEVALGSIFILPGRDEVVAAVYDPLTSAYSGGLHRYSTKTGKRLSGKELYRNNTTQLFGKATGFGDIISKCGSTTIEVGNYVWQDINSNGVQDAGEPPVANMPLQLLNSSCTEVGTATTDANGNYIFSAITGNEVYHVALPSTVFNEEYGIITVNSNEYVLSSFGVGSSSTDNNGNIQTSGCDNTILSLSTGFTNHTFDIGIVNPGGYDLAIKNVLATESLVKQGNDVSFEMTIFNQGGLPVKDIKVNNYISNAYLFQSGDNPGWTLTGNTASYMLPNVLRPGENVKITITLKLIGNALSDMENIAEICTANSLADTTIADVDSQYDSDPSNDEGGELGTATDNEVTDDGTFDEDDQDPAIPNIFDLALSQYFQESCLTGNDEITVKINVFNQGNVNSQSFTVVNYGGPTLEFSAANNPGWTEADGAYYYTGTNLLAGTTRTLDLVFTVLNASNPSTNYAEISNAIPMGSSFNFDFDSSPDNENSNDVGGTPNSDEDNFVDGKSDFEEDDHDPIRFDVQALDLALMLNTVQRVAIPGSEICFDIEIINQGYLSVQNVKVVDFVPSGLSMVSGNGWTAIANNTFEKEISINGGLAPGASFHEQVCLLVGNITGRYRIVNVAEISGMTDMCGGDISNNDIDSDSDSDPNNDSGGRPGSSTDNSVNSARNVDEDNHDPAMVINFDAAPSPCVCLSNASKQGDGQFSSDLVITGPGGLHWYVEEAIGFFNTTSAAPPAAPTTFAVGVGNGEELVEDYDPLTEVSTYTLEGIHVDGQAYTVRLVSDQLDRITLTGGGNCQYINKNIVGPRAVCASGPVTYSVPNPSGTIYTATSSGGSVISTSTDGDSITVDFGAPGSYIVSFVANTADACESPATLPVVAGTSDFAMHCRAQANLSIDQDCAVEITPSHIIAGDPKPGAAYAVMVTDALGNPVLNNIVNHTHVGKTLTVKLIEGCGGNSCWGELKIEDKMAPQFNCTPVVEVACNKADNYKGPSVADNCDASVMVSVLDSVFTLLTCDSRYTGRWTKKYVAEDNFGNKSAICEQTINIKKVVLDSIKFPASFKMSNALSCEDYDRDVAPIPSAIVGWPLLDGKSIYSNNDDLCNLYVTYSDLGPIYEGCATKYIRTWMVWDQSCSFPETRKTAEQIIIIADTEEPTVTCPTSFKASATEVGCEARVALPSVTNMQDDCSTNFQVDVTYPGGIRTNTNGGFQVFLPVGMSTVKYTIFDECRKSTTCEIVITVEDKTPPTPVCDQSTVVSLLSNGTTYLPATVFNDGSWDACGIASYTARRVDGGSPCNIQGSNFATYVDFCCVDVSKTVPVMVELLVTDLSNNKNTCMVSVFVQDKTKPTITCPDDTSIDCSVHYDLENLSAYGVATYQDACGANLTETADDSDVNTCNRGDIVRTFTVSDGTNSATCTQIIEVVNEEELERSDIVFPADFSVYNICGGANLNPDSLSAEYGYPQVINDDICSTIGINVEDHIFQTNTDGACFKIIRRWTVSNYCEMEVNPEYLPIAKDQVIKVFDTIAPFFTSKLDKVNVFTYNNSCEEGPVTLKASGMDSCTPVEEMFKSYQVYIDGVAQPRINGKGGSMDASDDYPVGEHYILWTFEDMCGNLVTRRQDFCVKNNKQPNAVSIDSVSIGLVPMDLDNIPGPETEMACILAPSLNQSSSHLCYEPSELTYAFDSLGQVTEICFDCFDLGDTTITWYVIDPDGNFDFTTVIINIQDNNEVDICPDLEECIEWPSNLDIVQCGIGTTPMALNSFATVSDSCMCDEFTITNTDTPLNGPNCNIISRLWTVTFTCGRRPQTFTYTQLISRKNISAPTISCPANVTVSANSDCEAEVVLNPAVVGSTACNTGIVFANTFNSGGLNASGDFPVGVTNINFSVTDFCNNRNSCSTTVTVNDVTPPMALCRDTTINLNANGTYTLTASDRAFIGRGVDNCVVNNVSVAPVQFNCSNIGPNIVVVTATSGMQQDTCQARITFRDLTPPVALCSPLTIPLGSTGSVQLTQANIQSITGTSTDNCSITTRTVTPNMFNCAQRGTNMVTATVTDIAGNTATCTTTVTVTDLPPVAICRNITVALDQNGNTTHSLTAQDSMRIIGNSTDACPFTVTFTPRTFSCASISPVLVVATVNDGLNTDTCHAFVTVDDGQAPNVACSNITVTLNSSGSYTLTTNNISAISAGSTDNCGFTVNVSPSVFSCTNVGPNNVQVIATDGLRSDTCTAVVTVQDNMRPNAICNAQTLYVGANGNATLSATVFTTGSTDNCGVVNRTLSQSAFNCTNIGSPLSVTAIIADAGGLTDTCQANITVLDTIPPVAVCAPITRYLNASGQYTLTAADRQVLGGGSTDNCGTPVITVTPTLFTCSQVGVNTVTVTATAGNVSATCPTTVTILDTIRPIAMCNDINVTLLGSGTYTLTSADSTAIVAGSSDACGFTATFNPSTFDCDDAGDTIAVTVTLTDPSGNISTCVADVRVIDNSQLMCITMPATIYINPMTGIATLTPEDVDGGSGGGCAGADIDLSIDQTTFPCNFALISPITVTLTVTAAATGQTLTCTALVTVRDTVAPVVTCPANDTISCGTFNGDFSQFGMATVDEVCQPIDTNIVVNANGLNNCGIGTATRQFIISDPSGNEGTCTQIITIEDSSPFMLSNANLPPAVVRLDGCQPLASAPTGTLTVPNNGTGCRRIGISFMDSNANGVNACNDTIVRTWTLRDTCQNLAVFTYNQSIIIRDTVPPMLTTTLTDTLFVENPDDACMVLADLSGLVSVVDCSNNVTVANNSFFSTFPNSLDASGTYPTGITVIDFYATDPCSNRDTIRIVINVEEADYQFNCIKGHPSINPTTLLAVVYPPDVAILSGVCDDITTYDIKIQNREIDFAFRDSVIYDCDDVGMFHDVYVFLFQNGVKIDSCTNFDITGRTTVFPFDSFNVCPPIISPIIAGNVTTAYNRPVRDMRIDLEGSNGMYEMTLTNGNYSFPAMAEGATYMVKPIKNDDVLNGVSTLDLILMQRHILKLSPLPSGYDIIAADVNNDRKITVSDITALRKVLLGIDKEFKNNMSWKAIDKQYSFPVVGNPFAETYPEYREIITDGSTIVDFTGVKIGDVNGSYAPSGLIGIEVNPRSNNKLYIGDQVLTSGAMTTVNMSLTPSKLYGAQIALDLKGIADELVSVTSGLENMVYTYDQGILKIVGFDGEEFDSKLLDIQITFVSNYNGAMSEVISLDNSWANETYTTIEEGSPLSIEWRSADVDFDLSQNKPNPWKDRTYIDLSLSVGGTVNMMVTDIDGKIVHKRTVEAEPGINSIEIRDHDVQMKSGVFLITFEIGGARFQQKMIRIAH